MASQKSEEIILINKTSDEKLKSDDKALSNDSNGNTEALKAVSTDFKDNDNPDKDKPEKENPDKENKDKTVNSKSDNRDNKVETVKAEDIKLADSKNNVSEAPKHSEQITNIKEKNWIENLSSGYVLGVILVLISFLLARRGWHSYTITITDMPNDFRHINGSFAVLLKNIENQEGSHIYKLPLEAGKMALVRDQIWITTAGNDYIIVLNLEGMLLAQLTIPGYQDLELVSILQVNDSEVVVSCETSLFVWNIDTYETYKLAEGDFDEISKSNNMVAALEWVEQGELGIYTFMYEDNKWVKALDYTAQIPLSSSLTMVMDNEIIYIASYDEDKLYKYSLDQKKIVKTYGIQGQSSNPGEVNGPLLAGIDKDGMLLICDSSSHRLQLLNKASGKWRIQKIDSKVIYPWDAIVTGDYVYILWGDVDPASRVADQQITRYTISK